MSQRYPAHHVGRALQLHIEVISPRVAVAGDLLVLLVRPDAHRSFAWAAGLARDAKVTLLVLPGDRDRPAWASMLTTGHAAASLDIEGRRSAATVDGVENLQVAIADGRVRGVLLEEYDEVLVSRADDTLVLTDREGHGTVVLRGPASRRDPDIERLIILEGPGVDHVVASIADELRASVDRLDPDVPPVVSPRSSADISGLALRTYQEEAVEAWFAAGMRGVLSMATGSGKTVTAIACAQRVRRASGAGLIIAVTAPLVHLVEQWADEFEALLGVKVIRCHTSRAQWLPEATTNVNLVRSGSRDIAVLAATHDTSVLAEFAELLRPVKADSLMVIADECHHLDAARTERMPQQASMRLGLTATPAGDIAAADGAVGYLGPVVTDYPMSRAIAEGVLCPYKYMPIPVRLTDDELSDFTRLSELLSAALDAPAGRRDRATLQRLMQERSDLLDSASGKIEALAMRIEAGVVRHTIIYCSGRDQLDAAQKICWDRGVNAHPFTGEESPTERRHVLERFASGNIPALAAIRCLDEGVDVPPARRAILLRSSANPTQSVQRRGRLLRRYEGKDHAVIEDLVAVGSDGRVADPERDRLELFAKDSMDVHSAMKLLTGV